MMSSSTMPAVGQHGMVASSQPAASAAGLEILREGGTAVDAALAMNAVLAVTEPYMCGPGGDFFALIWSPTEGRVLGLNASGRAPAGRFLANIKAALGDAPAMPMRGPHCVTLPGAVDGWCDIHARFGRLPLSRVMAPAIAAARTGFTVQPVTARGWALALDEIYADPHAHDGIEAFKAMFTLEGAAPAAGTTLRNPALADTFELIAREGRRGFYAGDLGQALLARMAAAGAPFSQNDLASVKSDWVAPLSTVYRGHEIYALPPNGQGAALLQILNLMSEAPPPSRRDDAAWWHWFIEAKKLAFADRARYYADPAFTPGPIAELIAPAYAAKRAGLINPLQAAADFPPGLLPGTDTTYFCAADDEGLVVSCIQSIFNAFGSTVVVPEGGFALHSRGAGFALDPAHPNVYAPGKRPFHTIMPGFATRDAAPRLAFGVIGADMQPQGQAQVLSNLLDFGCDVQTAGALPRLRHVGGAQPNGERAASVVWHDVDYSPAVLAGLAARGHDLRVVTPAQGNFLGGYQGMLCNGARHRFEGGSDPRFDGCALGY